MQKDTITIYKHNNTAYTDNTGLQLILNKKVGMINKHRRDGLPFYEEGKLTIFPILASIAWLRTNKPTTTKTKPEISNNSKENLEKMTIEEAERLDKILKVQLSQVKLDKEEGRLVDADDLDRALKEQAVLHLTDINNSEKVLPVLLENKSRDEITQLLHDYNENRIDTLHSQVKQKAKTEPSMLDLFNTVMEVRAKGIEPQQIVEALEVLH
jgi:hypothetical protein